MALPVTVTYDTDDLEIVMSGGTGDITVSVAELYSHWKLTIVSGNTSLAAVPPAWGLSVGGNDLGAGSFLDGYFFLNTVEGWTIRAEDRNHELTLEGNLYRTDPNVTYWSSNMSSIDTRLILTSRAIGLEQGSDLSTVLANQAVMIAALTGIAADAELSRQALLNRRELDRGTGTERLFDDFDVVLLEGDAYEAADGVTPFGVLSTGVERRDRMQ